METQATLLPPKCPWCSRHRNQRIDMMLFAHRHIEDCPQAREYCCGGRFFCVLCGAEKEVFVCPACGKRQTLCVINDAMALFSCSCGRSCVLPPVFEKVKKLPEDVEDQPTPPSLLPARRESVIPPAPPELARRGFRCPRPEDIFFGARLCVSVTYPPPNFEHGHLNVEVLALNVEGGKTYVYWQAIGGTKNVWNVPEIAQSRTRIGFVLEPFQSECGAYVEFLVQGEEVMPKNPPHPSPSMAEDRRLRHLGLCYPKMHDLRPGARFFLWDGKRVVQSLQAIAFEFDDRLERCFVRLWVLDENDDRLHRFVLRWLGWPLAAKVLDYKTTVIPEKEVVFQSFERGESQYQYVVEI